MFFLLSRILDGGGLLRHRNNVEAKLTTAPWQQNAERMIDIPVNKKILLLQGRNLRILFAGFKIAFHVTQDLGRNPYALAESQKFLVKDSHLVAYAGF